MQHTKQMSEGITLGLVFYLNHIGMVGLRGLGIIKYLHAVQCTLVSIKTTQNKHMLVK